MHKLILVLLAMVFSISAPAVEVLDLRAQAGPSFVAVSVELSTETMVGIYLSGDHLSTQTFVTKAAILDGLAMGEDYRLEIMGEGSVLLDALAFRTKALNDYFPGLAAIWSTATQTERASMLEAASRKLLIVAEKGKLNATRESLYWNRMVEVLTQ